MLATRLVGRQQSRLAERMAALKGENHALREQVRRLREDPSFIEEVARRDFGLIHPGERVFIIRWVPAASGAVAPETAP